MRILHLSDPHLLGDGTLHYGVVDTTSALARVLADADRIGAVDAVVCTGDVSDDGTSASYQKAQQLIEPWAARRGAQTLYLMGNHDQASGFEGVLGDRIGTREVAGMRFLRLDSSVPGAGYGSLGAEQLAWLRAELAASTLPAIVALHHPPTPANSALLSALQLRDPQHLIDVCAAGPVIAILAGHYHHPLVTNEGGIPVIVAPAIANTSDPYAPPGHERAVIGSGYGVIDVTALGAPRVTIHTVSSPTDGTEIFDLGPNEVAGIIATAASGASTTVTDPNTGE